MSPNATPWLPDIAKFFHDLLTSHLATAASQHHNDPRALQQPSNQDDMKSLKKTLAALRLDFVTLFHTSANLGSCTNDRAEALQGKVTINGKKQQANAEFGASVVFLSDFLGVNEARAAAVFQSACDLRASYPGWSKIKVAIHLFHRDRDYLLESLILMVTRFVRGKAADDVVKLISSFLGELLALPVSFPQKILESMKYLESTRDDFVRDTSLKGTITSDKVRQLNVEHEVFATHAEQLGKERNRLGDLLYFTTNRWLLTSIETVKLINVLRSVETVDVATVSLLCSLLTNLDGLHVAEPRLSLREPNYAVLKREIVDSPWQVAELGFVAATQWTLFLNCCASDFVDDRVVDEGFHRLALANYDEASRKWRDHIGCRPDVYAFIGTYMIPFRKNRQERAHARTPTEGIDIDSEMHEAYTNQVERLVDGLIVFLRTALKDIKCRDEDATRAAEQLERKSGAQSINTAHPINARARAQDQPAVTIREQTAWEALLFLIMILYRDRPDAAIAFWTEQTDSEEHSMRYQTPEKQAFVRMAADVRTSRFSRAFIHMLASLATGTHCAYQVHTKLNADPRDAQLGSVLWTTFFTSLSSAIDILGREHRDLPPREIDSIVSFLRLLRQVVKFSYSARRTLCDNQHLRAIHNLFWLLNSRVPVHLKAALLEAIAAFCIPLGNSYDIQQQVWSMLEQSQIVPATGSRNGNLSGHSMNGYEGILYDIEEIESKNGTYPEAMAFLRLFDVLLRGPNKLQMASVFQSLGMSERRPGIRPYIKLIIDHIFVKSFVRRCDDAEERAELISTCLRIFDRCLDLFDLGTLMEEGTADVANNEDDAMSLGIRGFGPQILHNAQILGLHPAFEILCALLGRAKLLTRIFDTISVGVDAVNTSAKRVSLCGKSVSIGLRILLRVLQGQKAFLEILAPALLEAGAAEWIGLPSAMAGLDHLLSFRNAIVINIAEYVMCVDDDICLLAVKILATLSQSPLYGAVDPAIGMNRLLALVQGSPNADRIVGGFVKRLETDEDERDYIPTSLEEPEGAEPGDVLHRAEADADEELRLLVAESWQSQPWPNPKAGVVHAVRIAILDLLLLNVTDAQLPTIGHFLLGYNPSALSGRTAEVRYNCLHAILGLIRVPTEADDNADMSAGDIVSHNPIFATHPRLAERCYRLIYRICVDPTLSASTMLYLRTHEDFFYQQLRTMPVGKAEEAEEADGAISGVLARLLQRTWLMKATALEMHVTIAAKQTWHTKRLIELLYVQARPTRGRGGYGGLGGDKWAGSTKSRADQAFEVPLTKIMEILNTMNFDELYRVNHGQVIAALFPHVNFEEFRPAGGALYDLAAVYHHLTSETGTGHHEKSLERVDEDVKRVLNALLAENQDREIGSARWQCAQAWSEIVQVTLTGAYALLPGDSREGIAFDILATVLHKMNSGRTSPQIAQSMSLVVLELLDSMQKDGLFQSLLQTSSLQADLSTIRMPTDTLLHGVLRNILKGILMAGSSLEMRGNLYVALIRFLQYTKPDEVEEAGANAGAASQEDLAASPSSSSASTTREGPAIAQSSIGAGRARLLQNIYSVITNEGDKLLEAICRDAADGSGVWNIVAFVALDAICELATYGSSSARRSGTKIGSWVLEIMVTRNFLGQFVRALNREDDMALRGLDRRSAAATHLLTDEALMRDGENDDDMDGTRGALNTHLLYEMKMAFLLQLSFQREGAQKLLEYGVVEALADCKFLDQRPESDGALGFRATGYDDATAIPADERYHSVLVPTLQLVLSVARQTQREHNAPARVAAFVDVHRHVLINILRDAPKVVTSATLKQVELVTALFSYLATDWRQDGESEGAASIVLARLPEAGHATLHDLLLALLNKYLAMDSWIGKLVPSSRVEEQKDQTKVVVLGRPSTLSQFRQEGESLAMSVCRNLLSYAVAVSVVASPSKRDRNAEALPSVMPLFRLLLNDEKDGGSLSRSLRASVGLAAGANTVTLNSATTPSLASLCRFCARTLDRLAQTVEDHRNVRLKIADIHRLSSDEIQVVVDNVRHLAFIDGDEDRGQASEEPNGETGQGAGPWANDALSAAQKRQLALVALHARRGEEVRLVGSLLYLLEHLLLLLWRHLVFMQASSGGGAPITLVGSGGRDRRESSVAATVSPLLSKLHAISFDEAAGGVSAGGAEGGGDAGPDARKMFLLMLARQIGEIVQVV